MAIILANGETYTSMNNGVFMLSGPASTLNFDSCMGDTAIITGTNDLVNASEGTMDTGLYDFGTGTEFSFWNIGKQAMTMSDLKVYNFQNDLTGQVRILTEFGSVCPDSTGWAWWDAAEHFRLNWRSGGFRQRSAGEPERAHPRWGGSLSKLITPHTAAHQFTPQLPSTKHVRHAGEQ